MIRIDINANYLAAASSNGVEIEGVDRFEDLEIIGVRYATLYYRIRGEEQERTYDLAWFDGLEVSGEDPIGFEIRESEED
jgi:hypothetical protein